MYVFALSEVDAYVVCAVAPEYEVTWLEVGGGYWFCVGLLGVGYSWEADAAFSVYVLYKSTAVEAGWCGAAPYIWYAEVFEGGGGDLFTFAFLYVVWIDGVFLECFPKWCVGLFVDENEGVAIDGYDAVGEFLYEAHWHVGVAFDHFEGSVFAFCAGGKTGVLFVIE